MSGCAVVRLACVAVAGLVCAVARAQPSTPPAPRAPEATPASTVPATGIIPPPQVSVFARPDSVTLKAGSTGEVIGAMAVRRRLALAELRARPVIALADGGRADLTPVLAGPAAAAGIAARLRVQPALVQLLAEETQAIEVEQGLIVRQFLSYKVKTGACTDPAKRALLVRSGATCMTRVNDVERAAAFANPGSPRFIADPARRAQAQQRARAGAAAEWAQAEQGIAQFRAMLRQPGQRAQIEAQIGAAEARRLEALGDAALADELANAAERQIEEVLFVPARGSRAVMPQAPMRPLAPDRARAAQRVEAHHVLPERVFLTGFTLGRDYEWRHRIAVTIKWCVLGCSRTYFAEVYAGFDYGLGLRLPIRVGGLYSYERVNGRDGARIAPVFEPIDASPEEFAHSGLPDDQIFSGRELVAQFRSAAGMSFRLPVVGSDGVGWETGHDFTAGLPAPFTGGQFRPPAPGDAHPPSAEVVFANPDLIGGLANFGVAGAKVLPAVKVSLRSERLQLKLADHLSGAETLMTSSGRTYPLAVRPDDRSSHFSIGHPEYELAFHITPGLAARLWVDVAVWSDQWDWPVSFPEVSLTLPPRGATFGCHAQTVCAREYVVSPDVAIDSAGEVALPDDPIGRQVEVWRRRFLAEWTPQCPYEKPKWCEPAIVAAGRTAANLMEQDLRGGKNATTDRAIDRVVAERGAEARATARQVIAEGKVRDVEAYAKRLAPVYEAVWSHGCGSVRCRESIRALVAQYGAALVSRQKRSPDLDRNEVVAQENIEGRWAQRARREVETSRLVAGAHPKRLPAMRPAGS